MQLKNSIWKNKRPVSIVLLIALLIAFIGGYFAVIYHCEYKKSLNREAVSLVGYHKDVCKSLENKMAFQDELSYRAYRQCITCMKMTMNNLKNIPEDATDVFQSETDPEKTGMDFYRLDANLNTVYESAGNPLGLSETELNSLIWNGKLTGTSMCYLCEQVQDGYYILAVEPDNSLGNGLDYELTKVHPYLILDNETDTAVEFGGQDCPESLPKLTLGELKGESIQTIDGVEIREKRIDGKNYLTAVKEITLNNRTLTVCLFTQGGSAERTAWFSASCSTIILLLFTLCCIFIVKKLRKKRLVLTEEERQTVIKSVPHYRPFKLHLRRSVIATMVAFLIGSTFLFSLENIMQINDEISRAFENLSLLQEGYERNLETVMEYGYKSMAQVVNTLGESLAQSGLKPDAWLKEMEGVMLIDEITLYDGEGKIVSSTTPYKGYRLSSNEADAEYGLWQILNGSAKQVSYFSEDGSKLYMGIRRTDDVGILLAGIPTTVAESLKSKIEFADLLTVQDYPNADKMYAKRSEPEVLYVLKAGSNIEKKLVNTLPFPDNGKNIVGIRKIEGDFYLYISLGSPDWATMFAYPVTKLALDDCMYFAFSAVAYVLTVATLMILLRKKTKPDSEEERNPVEAYNDLVAERKRVFTVVASALAVALVVALVGKSLLFTGSANLSDFFSSWEKGINLISLTYAIAAAWICFGIILFARLFNILIGGMLAAKGKTICTLIINLAKVVVVMAFVADVLEQFGVDASAIMASLGLTGLALSIGCKDVISDLVAGIFIIFEGQIQLGDYIQIDDFSGTVEALGIRTVKVKVSNKEMIFNNSSVKNVLNMSRGLASFVLRPVLVNNTDLERLKTVVEASSRRFNDACEGKLLGNISFKGVSSFKDHGIECEFMIPCRNQDSYICLRCCNAELIKILNENGFEFAVRE